MISSLNFKTSLSFTFIFLILNLFSQKTYYGDVPVSWEKYPAVISSPELEKYGESDLVIINDETEFSFYSSDNERITRNITFKINSEKGLEGLKNYTLPESFDPAYDGNYYKQGRLAKIKTPFIKEYTIRKFSARKYSSKKWKDVPFNIKYEKIRWIKSSGDLAGEFANEELNVFQMQELAVGDIVQVVYEASFNSNYGNNLFYFNSHYPKLQAEYTFIYKVLKRFSGYAFVLPTNVADTSIERNSEPSKDYDIVTDKIKLYNLKGINYPGNSYEGITQPHAFADFRVYRKLNGSFPSEGSRIYDFESFRPKNFEWLVFGDTVNNFTKVYDKQFASIRKFSATLPAINKDSSSISFFKALCDTFNNYRYLSSNHLFYNEANLRDVYSGDHLLKRRLVEDLQWKLYKDILNENKVFYSIVNVQDRRYGEHSPQSRAAYSYETQLIAIPNKDSYIYFMPRYQGLKYHLNELPFYFEGSLALLSPRNFQADVKDKDDHFFKFIRTHRGTSNENTRTENVNVRIVLDSLKADLTTKESLSGQFSTILRHIYLNEYIDSTIAPVYFKKCIDKPFASNSKIKLSSKMTEFPFRYNFNCTERLSLPGDKSLRLKNWFSFTLTKTTLPEIPNHDYYFDFVFSDSYNFLLNFKEPVELKNVSEFIKKINNEYFELESEIIANSETSYLLKVKLVVKQTRILHKKINLLMELVNDLEALNDFSLELARKA